MRLAVHVFAFAIGAGGCVQSGGSGPDDAVVVAGLLPFTGDLASSGPSLDRSLVLASEQLTSAGGVDGRPVVVHSRDTFAAQGPWVDLERALSVARQALEQQPAGVIGPENINLSQRVVALARKDRVVHFTGTFLPMDRRAGGCSLQLVPTASALGTVLAERMRAEGVQTLSVLFTLDPYGSALSTAARTAFEERGGQAAPPTSFRPGSDSYASIIETALASEPDAILLVGYPGSSSQLIQEWNVLGRGEVQWYLAPTLRTPAFLDNLPSNVLEGAIGVAPSVTGRVNDFRTQFRDRFQEAPLTKAAYYYDALVLLALAHQKVAGRGGEPPAYADVCAAVREVSGPPGKRIQWSGLGEALQRAKAGKDVDYEGLSGPVELNEQGQVRTSLVEAWTIEDGSFETVSVSSVETPAAAQPDGGM